MNDNYNYRWYKSHGICVSCRQCKATNGKVLCEACRRRAHERYDSKQRNKLHERYKYRKAKGLCVRCGVSRSAKDHVLCAECMDYQRKASRKSYKKRLSNEK